MDRIKAFFANKTRRFVQLVSLSLIGEWSFYGVFRCPFAVPYVGCGNCPVVQCPGISLWMWGWILIGLSALVFGRAFCGYACPGYLVSELLSLFAFMKNRVRGMVVRLAHLIRYAVLCASLYVAFILSNPRWAIPIRTGEFLGSVNLTFEHANPLWLYRTLFILVGVALCVIIPMAWCRFLCPTGGLLEIVSKFSIFKYAMTADCTDCGLCRNRCAMETRPAETDCTNCGDCLSTCGPKAIQLKRF